MSARGRGPDSTLVHMSPREVEGLQKLAVANGTSLTINPDTGLPEAFSLQDLLPTLIGGAATYLTGGAITPLMAALGTGAVTALTSKDLGKGLMAGLGAYGGASVTQGLMGLGTGALSAEAGAAASQGLEGVAADRAAEQAIKTRLADASNFDTLSAGASKAMSDPMSAVKAVGGGSTGRGLATLAGAVSPLLAGETGNTVQTVTKRPSTAVIRPYRYDNMSQTFEEGTPYAAAKGGLMRLAHGGAVHYEGGGPVGAAAAPFDEDAWLRNYIATKYPQPAAPVVTNTNAGSGFAATPAASNTGQFTASAFFDPNANFMNSSPADSGRVAFAEQFGNNAAPAAPVAETAPAPVAQVLPQAAQFSPPDFFDTSQAAQDVRKTFADQFVKDNANNAALVAAQGLYGSVLDRKAESPEVLQNWATKFGATIDDSERDIFRAAAVPETSTRANQQNYIPISGLNALYQSELGRPGTADPVGMAFWQKTFGDYIDPTELAGFKEHAARERAARPVVVNPVVQNPAVVTDLTTAGTQYIAPGVGGATGAGQIGGGTTINPNGTITTSPRIPGIRVGGFSGMTDVQRTYTDSGGSPGYTSYVPADITAFNQKYKNTGYQKEMYDYLTGKGDKPTKMKNADGTFREIARPYKEAVLGVPGSTNKRLTWDKDKGEYFRNPDYVRTARAPILDAAGKQKRDADGNYLYNTTTYKSINQAKAGIAENKLTKDSGSALLDWATQNNIDEQTVADALGIPLQDITSKFAKIKSEATAKVKKGGLLSLARGGMAYDNGGSVKPDFTNSKGEVFLWDWENGMYRPKEMTKDGKSYTWDKISNRYKPAGVGIAGLLDMSGGSNAGDARGPGTGNEGGIPGLNIDPVALALAAAARPFLGSAVSLGTPAPVVDATFTSTQAGRDYAGASGKSSWGKSGNEAQDIGTAPIGPALTGGFPTGTVDPDAGELGNRAPTTTSGIASLSGGRLSDFDNALANIISDEKMNDAAMRAADAAVYGPQIAATAANVQAAQNAAAMNSDIADVRAAFDAAVAEGAPDNSGSNTSPDAGERGGENLAHGGMAGYAQGGLGSLGGYSDGGRLLRGPGDGVSDSIPASIGNRQPARLADGEFVVPARIVSELGNGSTEAGARALYKMMARIQANRRKTTGKNSVAVDSKAHKYLPA